MGEDEVRKTWKDYFEDLYNMDTQEQIAVLYEALMVLGEVIILEESQLEVLKWRSE